MKDENGLTVYEWEIYGEEDENGYSPYLGDIFATSAANAIYEYEMTMGFVPKPERATIKYKNQIGEEVI